MRNDQILPMVLVGAILGIVAMGCKKSVAKIDGPEFQKRTNPVSPFQTHWNNETQFIVEQTVRELTEMIYLAAGKPVPEIDGHFIHARELRQSEFGNPLYSVEIGTSPLDVPFSHKLHVTGPIWGANTYSEFAETFSKPFVLIPANPSVSELTGIRAIEELATLDVATVEKWNQEATRKLRANYLDPSHHELAALVLGAFMLRENSGHFYEVRIPLCRMTAHLTMAGLLRGDSAQSVNGQLSEVLLSTIIGNQAMALEQLKALPKDEGLTPWRRALRAFNTLDYRELQNEKNLTLVEKFALFKAEAESIDLNVAWERVGERQAVVVPDFVRIANARGANVSVGHALLAAAVGVENWELVEYFKASQTPVENEAAMLAFLNQWPDRIFSGTAAEPQVQVIGPGLWASFFQRHLGHALVSSFGFLEYSISDPEAAKEWAKHIKETYASLYYAPFFRMFSSTTLEDFQESYQSGIAFAFRTPHLVPADCWRQFYSRPRFVDAKDSPQNQPDISSWHKHNPPPFTVYDLNPRVNNFSLARRPDSVEVFQSLQQRAPYNFVLAYNVTRILYGERQYAYEELEPLYHPMKEYSARTVQQLIEAVGLEPAEYERLAAPLAPQMPLLYLKLGDKLAASGEEERAAHYLELGVAQCKDPVVVASFAGWLIQYYHRNGETAKAHTLADFAADVYSYAGLEAMANLLFSEGRYPDSLKYREMILERYGRADSIIEFCSRHRQVTGKDTYDALLNKHLGSAFRNGVTRVTLSELNSPPAHGVKIMSENERTAAAGLSSGDTVVAVNGLAVSNSDEWLVARGLGKTNEIALIVWNDGEYRELVANPPGLSFGVRLEALN